METPEEILDLVGLKCPLPALLTRRRLQRVRAGTIVVVLTDDPMAPVDIPYMCSTEGAADVILIERNGDSARIMLRRTAPEA